MKPYHQPFTRSILLSNVLTRLLLNVFSNNTLLHALLKKNTACPFREQRWHFKHLSLFKTLGGFFLALSNFVLFVGSFFWLECFLSDHNRIKPKKSPKHLSSSPVASVHFEGSTTTSRQTDKAENTHTCDRWRRCIRFHRTCS